MTERESLMMHRLQSALELRKVNYYCGDAYDKRGMDCKDCVCCNGYDNCFTKTTINDDAEYSQYLVKKFVERYIKRFKPETLLERLL